MGTIDPPVEGAPSLGDDPAHEPDPVPSPVPDPYLRTLLTHLTEVAVLVVDPQLRFIGAGGAGLAAKGWDPSELLGRSVHEAVPGDQAAALAGLYQRALDGEHVRVQQRGVRAPDRLHDVEVVPIRDAAGDVEAALVIAHDITEDLAAARALSEQEQRLRALAASSGDMLALYDTEGRFLEVSPAATTLFGWAPEELLGTSCYELFHPADVAPIRQAHAEVLGTGEVGPISYRLRCADGSYRWVEVVGRAVRDATSDAVTAIQCTTRDVTTRTEQERARDTATQRLRTTLRHAPIGMALVGLDGRAIEVNDALCTILQRSREELLGVSIAEVTHPDDLDVDLALLGEVLTGDRTHYAIAKRYLLPDGSPVSCELHVAALRDEHQDPTALIAQVVDVSQREATEAELQAANAALLRSNAELERFAAVASHDLRGPLHTTRGLLDLLGSRITLQEASLEADVFRRACAQLDRLSDTVDSLLDLALLGTRPLRSAAVPLSQLLAEVMDALELDTACPPGDVRLITDVTLTGDPRLLHVLLQNLVSNALRSAEDDRRISVEVTGTRDAAGWLLRVEDDGDGIPLTLRDHLFRPFSSGALRSQSPGHGLGLATCQRIVERHDGSIEVEHLAWGTAFVVRIPDPATALNLSAGAAALDGSAAE